MDYWNYVDFNKTMVIVMECGKVVSVSKVFFNTCHLLHCEQKICVFYVYSNRVSESHIL